MNSILTIAQLGELIQIQDAIPTFDPQIHKLNPPPSHIASVAHDTLTATIQSLIDALESPLINDEAKTHTLQEAKRILAQAKGQ